MKPIFNRRVLLRGLGGAVVAAPFLPSVAERQAKAQGMGAPGPPKRLIVYFTHYGCLTNRWFPAKSHGRLTRDDYAQLRTLAPLAPYADKLLMVRGIRAMNEWSFEGTLGQKNDPHMQVCGSFFTGHPVTPTPRAHHQRLRTSSPQSQRGALSTISAPSRSIPMGRRCFCRSAAWPMTAATCP